MVFFCKETCYFRAKEPDLKILKAKNTSCSPFLCWMDVLSHESSSVPAPLPRAQPRPSPCVLAEAAGVWVKLHLPLRPHLFWSSCTSPAVPTARAGAPGLPGWSVGTARHRHSHGGFASRARCAQLSSTVSFCACSSVCQSSPAFVSAWAHGGIHGHSRCDL